ncbi:MAG TPA: alpha-mannosidase, partial [Candidatus Latescibacteria bacterium]|nr:alpha-mannosidase [Candidatus Latescibacterota bacterium]
ELLGIPIDSVKIDWEPDLFGHARTVPSVLARAGVVRYYFCRGGKGLRLFWWQGPDGSRVLAFDDGVLWYNGSITPDMTRLLFEFEKATGLKDYLFVYGVGDHGGGPTKGDLMAAREMDSWPIFPNIRLSTTEEYFSAIEQKLPEDLPVVDDELNFVFRGCYTSQSEIKRANRISENRLVEAEVVAVVAHRLLGTAYPSQELLSAWRNAMFNQFHDILPGSGVHATYEYAQGLFQEILAKTGTIKTRSLRALAADVDTSGMDGGPGTGPGLGAGAGNESALGTVSDLSGGAVSAEPFLVFNPNPWERDDVVSAKVWDKEIPEECVLVRTAEGEEFAGQVLDKGNYWGHRFTTVAFPVRKLPPVGYRVYSISRSYAPLTSPESVRTDGGVMENEFLKVEVDQGSGALSSLVDKRTGYEFVPEGKRLGFLQWLLEAPHGMTAWEIGQIVERLDLLQGATTEVVHRGPYIATIRAHRKFRDSRFALDISLKAGLPRVEFTLRVEWLERGSPEYGVPMLRVVFPLALREGKACFEIPFGYIERPADGEEVPALKWVDLTGRRVKGRGVVGATLVNDCKYGHSTTEEEIRLTLLRSSYDPDPLPELGRHEVRFAIVPHGRDWNPSEAARAGYEFNHPPELVATDVHEGDLPKEGGFISVSPPNILLSSIKKAEEDDDALIVRLYETEGKSTEAQVRLDPSLAKPNSSAVEVDLLERPLPDGTARMEGKVLKVQIPAFGITTVKIG